MSSFEYAYEAATPVGPEASPQQLRDALVAQPGRALEVAVHPNADESLRQWLWETGDDELRLGMYQHYLFQREQLLGAWQPLPAQAIQFDAAVAQAQLLLESGRMPIAEHTVSGTRAAEGIPEHVIGGVSAAGPVALRLTDGTTVNLTATRVLLGRSPKAGAYPDAQLVSIPDPSRQLSSTHALLEKHESEWRLTDLHSTNGTTLGDGTGAQVAAPGVAYSAPSRFVIGRQTVEIVAV